MLMLPSGIFAQPVPAEVENIPHLVTFGNKADTHWGDDDFCNIFFFVIPQEYRDPVYIRVFDPECIGAIDEINGFFNTKTEFSIYGGEETWSNEDAKTGNPTGNFRSGNLLVSKTFGGEVRYDEKWYSFGPFNPTEGEYVKDFQGYVFKIIVMGIDGDDGNLYNFYLSSSDRENLGIEGANAFTYEYCFRLYNDPNQISHIYPYVDDRVISIRQTNFDWDDDGIIRTVTVARQNQLNAVSGDNFEVASEFKVQPEELNTSFDFQFIKSKNPLVRNNNVVITVKNQYGEALPFNTVPIGGVPKFRYGISVKPIKR
ncbi:MAG: hypothetical protein GXO83_00060 [Chlorobi bacterium]|nr:hypothetical protein [Chlorobiota bacterium]